MPPIFSRSMPAELLPQLQAALGEDYRFEKELGGGGMSRVFVALELGLARRVVVKVLAPELASWTRGPARTRCCSRMSPKRARG